MWYLLIVIRKKKITIVKKVPLRGEIGNFSIKKRRKASNHFHSLSTLIGPSYFFLATLSLSLSFLSFFFLLFPLSKTL